MQHYCIFKESDPANKDTHKLEITSCCEAILMYYKTLKLVRFDTEAVKTVEVSKPKAEDDLNAEETSSEEEDDLTREGQELKDMLDREEGRESWDEEEEDPDQDDIKGTSALFLQGWKEPGYYCYM